VKNPTPAARYNSFVPVRIVSAEDPDSLAEAADRLRRGLLVALPTETVYGLGANALDPAAVARIFAAKGRPSTNPLIVHVPDAAAARGLASDWPPAADALAAAFWPGPLTLVVEKAPAIPDIVTAGGPTVGLRVPDHPVALELLRLAGVPVAAPSANRSEEVSPTTAQHVADSLGPWTDDLLILDGGPCRVGIESTVVDMTDGAAPCVLRPGMVTAEQVAAVAGAVGSGATGDGGPARSPGQMLRHYAPRTPVTLCPFDMLPIRVEGVLLSLAAHLVRQNNGKAVFRADRVITMPLTPDEYATRLYAALREADEAGAKHIVVQLPPDGPEWEAVHDRLRRAASPQSEAGE
jgi:L-threonylcarbamoyladenylate synthase